MKRDLDLYRDILLYVEEALDPSDPRLCSTPDEVFAGRGGDAPEPPVELHNRDPRVVLRHLELMGQAGLIQLSMTRNSAGGIIHACVQGITHDGHDFLDTIRDDTVWNRTKAQVGDAALHIVKAVAEGVTKAQLGL